MKTFKVIGNCCLVFLSVIAVCISLAFGYYHFFVDDITMGTNYIDNQVGLDIEEVIKSEDLSLEEKNELEDRYFLQVNYYSNDKNNGIKLQELKMNYFTDYTLLSSAYMSTGMQYVGNYQGVPCNTWDGNSELKFANPFGNNHRYYGTSDTSVGIANNFIDRSFYYYDSIDGISFNGVTNNNGSIATELKRTTQFIVKIGGRAFAIQLDKYFDKDVGDVRNIFGIGWKVGEKYNRLYYTYGSLFQTCMQAVSSNSASYGDYYIKVNLSNFFSVSEFDIESGKYKADDVTDVINTYAVLKFHYDENGCINANQSMFGQIYNDKTYGVHDEIDTTYWQEKLNYTLEVDTKYLNENIFNYRYSEVYDGYFISMTMDAKKLFAEMPRTKVNIYLDLNSEYLQSKEINVVGIDYNGFENFEIDTLTINGNIQTFYVLDKGLSYTKLQTLKHSAGITFEFATNSINNEYVEVVL